MESKHYPSFTCAGNLRRTPSRPRWDARPLVKGLTLLCAALALWGLL